MRGRFTTGAKYGGKNGPRRQPRDRRDLRRGALVPSMTSFTVPALRRCKSPVIFLATGRFIRRRSADRPPDRALAASGASLGACVGRSGGAGRSKTDTSVISGRWRWGPDHAPLATREYTVRCNRGGTPRRASEVLHNVVSISPGGADAGTRNRRYFFRDSTCAATAERLRARRTSWTSGSLGLSHSGC